MTLFCDAMYLNSQSDTRCLVDIFCECSISCLYSRPEKKLGTVENNFRVTDQICISLNSWLEVSVIESIFKTHTSICKHTHKKQNSLYLTSVDEHSWCWWFEISRSRIDWFWFYEISHISLFTFIAKILKDFPVWCHESTKSSFKFKTSVHYGIH
jgi:hypothetical protein